MTCNLSEQGGIKKIVLYENIDIVFVWDDYTTVDSIFTGGETITLDECDFLNFEDIESIGANDKIMHNYTVSFRYFDLDLDTIEDIETLINTYGWIVALHFNNGEIKTVETPFFFQESDALETNVSHSYNLTLKPNVITPNDLLDYNDSTLYSITFNVTDPDSDPINGATITFDSTIKGTNSEGEAVFYRSAGTYSYLIEYTGYGDVSDSVTVGPDAIENVQMDLPVTNISNGRLYNAYAAQTANLLNTDWEIGDATDWDTLITYLGGSTVAGGKMKYEDAPIYEFWNTPNTGADNSSGFTAFGSGQRSDVDGVFSNLNTQASFWTSEPFSSLYYKRLLTNTSAQIIKSFSQLATGHQVRGIYKGSGTPASQITDYDGNIYDTILIGTQYWMVQNWACTHLNDGTALTEETDNTAWAALTTEGYCSYDNDDSYVFV